MAVNCLFLVFSLAFAYLIIAESSQCLFNVLATAYKDGSLRVVFKHEWSLHTSPGSFTAFATCHTIAHGEKVGKKRVACCHVFCGFKLMHRPSAGKSNTAADAR